MERLRLCGLPEHLKVGPAALRPVAAEDGLLQPCRVCTRVNINYHLCASGHSLCPDCIPPSDTRRNWCVVCEASVDFTDENISPRIIEAMAFSCACSFTATLPEISEHLRNTTTPQVCYMQRGVGIEEPEVPCDECRERLDALIREQEQTRCSLRRLEAMMPGLTGSLSELETLCEVLSGARKILCFSFATLLGGQASEGRAIVNGVPLRIQALIYNRASTPYLRVSVAGADIDPEDSPWPLQRRITIRILDLHGRAVRSHDVLTYENGRYTHESFIDPTSSTLPGVSFYEPLNALFRHYPRRGSDTLLISVAANEIG